MINSQEKLVLSHLENKGPLTPMQSFSLYGITKLATVVSELKKKGNNIITTMTAGVNRYGHKVKYATYTIVPKN